MKDTICPICEGGTRLWGEVGRFRIHRCGACRVGFVDPQPSKEELDAAYNEERICYTLSFLLSRRERACTQKTASRRAGRLRRLLPSGGRVLDVGAGVGLHVAAFLGAGFEVEAIELDQEKAAHIENECAIAVHRGFFEDLEFERSFDAVNMDHLIEHARQPQALIARASRLLRPRGVLSVATPDLDGWVSRLAGLRSHVIRPPLHLFFFTRQSLIHAGRAAGLTVERIDSVGRLRRWDIEHRLRKWGPGWASGPLSCALWPVSLAFCWCARLFGAGMNLEVYFRKPK